VADTAVAVRRSVCSWWIPNHSLLALMAGIKLQGVRTGTSAWLWSGLNREDGVVGAWVSVCDSDDRRAAWDAYCSCVLAVVGTYVSGLAGGEVLAIGGAGELLTHQAGQEQQ
jgi:hypothetical protein